MARGGSNYIPRPDGAFDAWAINYYTTLKPWWIGQGLDPGEMTGLEKDLNRWRDAWDVHVAAQAAAEGARQAKDQARAMLEAAVRRYTNFVQGYPATTDADRASFGITVRETGRTPSPTPTTRPLVTVNVANRLTHELRLVDSDGGSPTGGRRGRGGKPPGVSGAEVWVKLVDAGQPVPTDPNALSFLTLTTRPTLRTDFPTAAAGKTAVYMLRWVNTRGEKGPWSEVATATVAA